MPNERNDEKIDDIIICAAEFGYLCCESGDNIQMMLKKLRNRLSEFRKKRVAS